jgi:hypothetical protein
MGSRESRRTWEQRVERWQRSGQSARQFAAREGVRAATLTWWRWRLAQDRPSAEARRRGSAASHAVIPADFVEVIRTAVVGGRPISADLELELAAGYRVRLAGDFSGEALSRLLDVLEARR